MRELRYRFHAKEGDGALIARIGGTTMGDQDEWGQSDATEMGATVQQPTRYVYRYRCNSCGVVGQNWDSESEAQSDGLQHEQSAHPRLYTVEAVGTHD